MFSVSVRCGGNFCSLHRYAEAHGCSFDYKLEGRRLIEQSNPLIAADKLPKIWRFQRFVFLCLWIMGCFLAVVEFSSAFHVIAGCSR